MSINKLLNVSIFSNINFAMLFHLMELKVQK